LNCSYNEIYEIPELPSSLKKLWCFSCRLIKLPDLPSSLELLMCEFNNLTVLPWGLDNLSLKILSCELNNVKYKITVDTLKKYYEEDYHNAQDYILK
jgi:hypothetical protein